MEQERLEKLRDHISKINAKRALAVEVTDTETGNIVKYESVRQAARELGTTRERLIKVYDNADTQKLDILQENKNKSGIYL
ncbi:hypothetical protein CJF30_00010694 [Rutstroemia sp. NJR-2017a BBW]|nr:hypothetical protein CJF30_00010694 [Rutstroemia sp. NJR-2017a BBW]